MPGQVSLIKLVIRCTVQKSWGLVAGIKNVFCLKWKSGIRLQARRTRVPQSTKKQREEDSFKWKNKIKQNKNFALSLAKFKNYFLYLILSLSIELTLTNEVTSIGSEAQASLCLTKEGKQRMLLESMLLVTRAPGRPAGTKEKTIYHRFFFPILT